ncbi:MULTISPECIES: hypothetical protein [Bhargavaea]|uniref:Uncharacterized protein n=1 Tax=Bhargavaea beijingensis TaxID=426756 RepID=A0A1G7BQW1_9BACL|nr:MULTISPECIES: hypothetical protein [Bhargavaea]MCW1926755.1 hypothetical protein [Bhargavaea beijingensis]SDE28575.1 hypothetical protein SAMN04488126_10652 [Bhargavaea beijingensis]
MMKQEQWWDHMFTGNLEMGLNRERITELEEENFLYFSEAEESVPQEQ